MKIKKKVRKKGQSDIILYTTPKGDIKIEVFFQDETVWLTQKRMAELFGVEAHTINYHLKEIFKSGELREKSTIRKIRVVQAERIFCYRPKQNALCNSWPYGC